MEKSSFERACVETSEQPTITIDSASHRLSLLALKQHLKKRV